MERSLDSLAGMATSAFGAGTSAAMRQATSPKTILEYIINFFTCGGVRRKNEAQYQELIDTMADTLKVQCLTEVLRCQKTSYWRIWMGVVSNLIFLVRITKLDKLLYGSVKATILR
ncbi:effector protein pipB2 [Salmonella enterica subsp. enterica]|nr:effector protein pipB2 [Salmonella enterica subsp. enterica]